MLDNVGQEASRALDSFGPTEAGGRADRARSEGCSREDRGRAPEAEAREKETLEGFEPFHDPFNFVDHCVQRIRANRITERTLRECTCRELYHRGNLGLNIRLRGERHGETCPEYFSLLVGFPIGCNQRNPVFEDYSIKDCYRAGGRMRDRGGDNVVFVGVREFANEVEGMTERVFLSMERLHSVQQVQAKNNTRDAPVSISLPLVAGGRFISGLRNENGELVLLRSPGFTFLDERRNYIIERTPETVYKVTNDDAEFMFSNFARRQENRAPAVFIDLTDLNGIRCILMEGSDGIVNLSQERVEVYASPCNLCA